MEFLQLFTLLGCLAVTCPAKAPPPGYVIEQANFMNANDSRAARLEYCYQAQVYSDVACNAFIRRDGDRYFWWLRQKSAQLEQR